MPKTNGQYQVQKMFVAVLSDDETPSDTTNSILIFGNVRFILRGDL